MFEGFERVRAEAEGVSINAVRGGRDRRFCCCTAAPQTLAMWHLLAPRLAEDFTVIATDLRGYVDSSVPCQRTIRTSKFVSW
jgi:haloacetate dehalogenase